MKAMLLCLVMLTTFLPVVAHAQPLFIRLEYWEGANRTFNAIYESGGDIGPNSPNPTQPPAVSANVTRINLYSDQATLASIGPVQLTGNTRTTTLDVYVGSGAMPSDVNQPIPDVATNCSSFVLNGGLAGWTRFGGAISGNIAGTSLDVREIVRLQLGGALQAPLSASLPAAVAIQRLVVGTTTSSGSVTATAGSIGSIQANGTGIAIAGSIRAPSGSIAEIQSFGAITITNPGAIEARDGIARLTATTINANITANVSGTGDLGYFRITSTTGSFQGSLRARNLGDSSSSGTDATLAGINLSGPCAAQLIFNGDAYAPIFLGSASTGASVHVLHNLHSSIIASSPGNPLTVQIDGDITWNVLPGEIPIRFIKNNGQFASISVGGNITPGHLGFLQIQATDLASFVVGSSGTVGDAHGVFITRGVSGNPYVTVGAVNVKGDFTGQIAANSIGSVSIGGDLGGAIDINGPLPPASNGAAARVTVGRGFSGRISVRGVLGLTGQILFNTTGSPDAQCDGTLAVGLGSPTTDDEIYIRSPLYGVSGVGSVANRTTPNPTRLGGGSLGMLPFALYDSDCDPTNNDDLAPILQSQFSGIGAEISPVIIRFPGPVFAESATLSPVRVWKVIDDVRFLDVTSLVNVSVDRSVGDPYSREVRVQGNGVTRFADGWYVVFDENTAGSRLLCDGGSNGFTPTVREFYYFFRLGVDCAFRGERGSACPNQCVADVDDGGGMGQRDGGVSIDDLLFYLRIFGEGFARADIDDGTFSGHPDGGVDIGDLLYFLNRYNDGC